MSANKLLQQYKASEKKLKEKPKTVEQVAKDMIHTEESSILKQLKEFTAELLKLFVDNIEKLSKQVTVLQKSLPSST